MRFFPESHIFLTLFDESTNATFDIFEWFCPQFDPVYNEQVRNLLFSNLLRTFLLRRPDSNERPPGYEPGELPTAPLRDVFLKPLQRYDYNMKTPNISGLFLYQKQQAINK